MQLLYLLPPALMLWQRLRRATVDDLVLLVPVLVMAAGQLAGGLAWLAISGEDAPDLVATAPIPASFDHPRQGGGGDRQRRRGVRAVRHRRWRSPRRATALAAALGIVVAAVSATLIQLWFRTQARRKHFRRRQTSSRIATFAEAFSSIAWAATAGLAAAGHWPAAITALTASASWWARGQSARSGRSSAEFDSRRGQCCGARMGPSAQSDRTHVVVMQGDGIGPEITAATLQVLREVDRLLSLGLIFRGRNDRASRRSKRTAPPSPTPRSRPASAPTA